MFAQDPQVIAVRVESKFKTIKDLVEAAKREPTRYRWVSRGREREPGASRSTSSSAPPARNSGYVTFKGGGDAVLATLGGHVEITGENMSEMLPLVESKKMRVLAVMGERRFVQAPDIPTAKELGFNIVAATGRGFAHARRRAEGSRRRDGGRIEARLRQPGLQGVFPPQHVRQQLSRQRRVSQSILP